MATWSPIWSDASIKPRARNAAVQDAAFQPPMDRVSKKGGGYPHKQPFFKNKKQEAKIVEGTRNGAPVLVTKRTRPKQDMAAKIRKEMIRNGTITPEPHEVEHAEG